MIVCSEEPCRSLYLTTGDSAIVTISSFHHLSSIHGNSWRRIVLRRHLLILVVRIAVARYASNLGRKMWLLLGALAIMWLRRCVASHRRCYVMLEVSKVSASKVLTVLRWLLCINRCPIRLITHVHGGLPLIRALMHHGCCSSRTWKSTWWLRRPSIWSNLSRSEHWHLGRGHAMWTYETSLTRVVDHHWGRELLPW